MWTSAVLLLTVVLTVECSWCLYNVIMAHQVLEEYDSLRTSYL